MSTRINLVRNPSFSTNLTDWAADVNTGSPTFIRNPAGTGPVGETTYARLTTSVTVVRLGAVSDAVGANLVTPGQVYTFSGYIRPTTSVAANGQAVVVWLDNTSTQVGSTQNGPVVALTTSFVGGRVSVTTTAAPAGAVRARVFLRALPSVGSFVSGDIADFGASLLEVGSTLANYFDGDTAFAAWNGTAGASASTLYAPVITLTQFVDQNPGIRVQVALTDVPPSAPNVNITRLVEGRTMKVRGGVNLFAVGGANVMDFEAPIGVAAVYQAELLDNTGLSIGFSNTASTTIASSSIPGSAYAVVHQPLKPVLNVTLPMDAETSDVVVNPVPGQLFYPEGGTVGIWVGGRRHGIQGMKLTVVAQNFTDADEFRSMFGDYTSDFPSVICVRTIPPVRLPRVFFCSVSELHESVDYVNSRVIFQLVVDEVSPPTAALIIPALRREDIDAAFLTRAARAAAYATRVARDSDYTKAGLAGP